MPRDGPLPEPVAGFCCKSRHHRPGPGCLCARLRRPKSMSEAVTYHLLHWRNIWPEADVLV
ncbi:protein of unknown function [Methylorubrum extorquens DM4]|uniref:Uncharacterized protein n=1 Tax=Methylorubrum extorquens (strain DSM 6343 / CIP 106787 / DM4) TaxID=661410 RepID=C7CBY0_METED|nr:protein of unknown function [Methylorubrum extorquens DM4]